MTGKTAQEMAGRSGENGLVEVRRLTGRAAGSAPLKADPAAGRDAERLREVPRHMALI